MKNVIILSSGGARYAVELRWVREVVSLGHITRVPGAPEHIAGVANVRGAITPVIDLAAFRAGPGELSAPRPVTSRDHPHGAVVIEVDAVCAALRMDAVDEISTAGERPFSDPAGGIAVGAVEDSRGREVILVDPPRVLELARDAAVARAADLTRGARRARP